MLKRIILGYLTVFHAKLRCTLFNWISLKITPWIFDVCAVFPYCYESC